LKIPFSRYWKRAGRNQLRGIMRGYRYLKSAGELDRIKIIKEDLANSRFLQVENKHRGMIFGAGSNSSELIIRQYLLARIANLNFNKALLYATGKPNAEITYPMPRAWRNILRTHGYKVSTFRSALSWYAFILLAFIKGIFTVSQIMAEAIRRNKYNYAAGRYAFFYDISGNNLPQTSGHGSSYDIVTWYWEKFQDTENIQRICHTVPGASSGKVNGIPTEKLRSALPPLPNFAACLQLAGWCLIAGALALIDIFRGYWWHALIFKEAVLAKKARLLKQEAFAVDYLFHNSNWIFRPLWTYEAAKKGSRITLYFYATNIETFKRPGGYVLQANCWQTINWPHYMVWDQYQADFIKRFKGPEANISIVGPIWFHSGMATLPQWSPRSVAVFDVQPVRDAFYETLGLDSEYYTPEVCNQFLADISELLRQNNTVLVYKGKRKVGRLIHYKYRNLLATLDNDPCFVSVDADVAAQQLIEHCSGVISMPFTSTAILGERSGKPSIYYDPLGMIQKDDRAAHGIKVVSGRAELNEWLLAVL
jgi:polysaccharide biosynthesis PFTS motif protein